MDRLQRLRSSELSCVNDWSPWQQVLLESTATASGAWRGCWAVSSSCWQQVTHQTFHIMELFICSAPVGKSRALKHLETRSKTHPDVSGVFTALPVFFGWFCYQWYYDAWMKSAGLFNSFFYHWLRLMTVPVWCFLTFDSIWRHAIWYSKKSGALLVLVPSWCCHDCFWSILRVLLLQASLQVSSGGTKKLVQGLACGIDFNRVITSDLFSRSSPL